VFVIGLVIHAFLGPSSTMKPIAILAFLAALTSSALAQSTTYYDSRGSVTGHSQTLGNTTTFWDQHGSKVGSETWIGRSTTQYDAHGSVIGRSTTMPRPSFDRAFGIR
jgi:YD repeat-containing protein